MRCRRSRPANEPAEAPERCGMWILAVDFLAPRFMSWIRPPIHWMPRVGRSKPPTDYGPYSPPPHRRAVISVQRIIRHGDDRCRCGSGLCSSFRVANFWSGSDATRTSGTLTCVLIVIC